MRKRIGLAALLSAFLVLGVTVSVAAATPWKIAVLVYRGLDVTCNGVRHVDALDSVVIDPATVGQRVGTTITSWSDGASSAQVTVFEMGTLRSVTFTGSYCWPTPSNVQLPPGFDSYVVLYDGDQEGQQSLNPFMGLAYNGLVNGYTYATAKIPDGGSAWMWNTVPENTAIHEWMHGSAGFYRSTFGARIPGVHDSGQYGYTDSVAWHRDFLGGDISGGLGFAPDVWASGTPTSGTAPSEPPAKECKNPQSQAKACR